MKGIGGPLLNVGDLLSDLGEKEEEDVIATLDRRSPQQTPSSSITDFNTILQSLDLTKLFEEDYKHLNEAFAGSDHSWTALTLKLCTALETANKLVQSTHSNAKMLSEKVGELEETVKRGDSAVAAARVIQASVNKQ